MKFILLFFISLFALSASLSEDNSTQLFKLLLYYQTESSIELSTFDYKNIVLSNSQLTVFGSDNKKSKDKDKKMSSESYLYTLRFEYLDTPCLEGSFMCYYGQFQKEFKDKNYDMNCPQAIINERVITQEELNTKCVLLFEKFSNMVSNALWVCHPDQSEILEFAKNVTSLTRKYHKKQKETIILTKHIEQNSFLVDGELVVTDIDLFFRTIETKEERMRYKLINVKESVQLLSETKEMINDWVGDEKVKPEENRCFKLVVQTEGTNTIEYFCFYDIDDKTNVMKGNKMAEKYARLINEKLMNVKVHSTLDSLLSGDTTIKLTPILNDLQRKIDKEKFTLKLIGKTKIDILSVLNKKRIDEVNKMCKNDTICREKLLELSKDVGKNNKTPLTDVNNPYIEYLNTINKDEILSAWKTLRQKNKEYHSIEEITTQCKDIKEERRDVTKERLLDLLHYTDVNLFWNYVPNLGKK